MVSSLDDLEKININGRQYEAFSTSGGLGTMCETLEGKVDTLNYKTMRYPGHRDGMKFLLYDLHLKNDRELYKNIINNTYPIVEEEHELVTATVEGILNVQLI